MEVKAEVNHIRVTPRKMKELAGLIRGLKPQVAIEKLNFLNKSGAQDLARLIKSAMANAVKNFNLHEENLKIKTLESNTAGAMKRFRAASRGVAHSYKKRMAHVKIVLEG
jgi:large subunit ribosomal protein L22